MIEVKLVYEDEAHGERVEIERTCWPARQAETSVDAADRLAREVVDAFTRVRAHSTDKASGE